MGPGSLQNMTLCHISLISIFFCISSPPCICACVCARCELLLCVWFTSISSDYLHTAYTCTSNISIYSFSLTEEIKSFYIAQLKLKLTKKKYPSQATLMQCHFAYWTNLIFNTDAQTAPIACLTQSYSAFMRPIDVSAVMLNGLHLDVCCVCCVHSHDHAQCDSQYTAHSSNSSSSRNSSIWNLCVFQWVLVGAVVVKVTQQKHTVHSAVYWKVRNSSSIDDGMVHALRMHMPYQSQSNAVPCWCWCYIHTHVTQLFGWPMVHQPSSHMRCSRRTSFKVIYLQYMSGYVMVWGDKKRTSDISHIFDLSLIITLNQRSSHCVGITQSTVLVWLCTRWYGRVMNERSLFGLWNVDKLTCLVLSSDNFAITKNQRRERRFAFVFIHFLAANDDNKQQNHTSKCTNCFTHHLLHFFAAGISMSTAPVFGQEQGFALIPQSRTVFFCCLPEDY